MKCISDLIESETHQRIRRQWRLATICIFIGWTVFLNILAWIGDVFDGESVRDLISTFIAFWIAWECAYKKPGTKWLTWQLISFPILFVFSLVKNSKVIDGAELFFTMLFLLPYTWWYIATIRLLKANKEIQQRHLRDNPKEGLIAEEITRKKLWEL